jgi:cytochrome b pre-mRNA-processing protein 3
VIYREFSISDDMEARFEVLVLHLFLVLNRLSAEQPGQALGQGVFDRFCQDMDDEMREMGVGDLTVPKKMRRVADAFYGRSDAYRASLGDEDAMTAALAKNVYGGTNSERASALARYVRAVNGNLARADVAELAAARLAWPDIAAISR